MNRDETGAGRLHGWFGLLAGLAVILVVMFVIGPLVLKLPGYREMSRFIEAEGIRSTAIYYTDIEAFANAEFALRQRLVYGPVGPGTK